MIEKNSSMAQNEYKRGATMKDREKMGWSSPTLHLQVTSGMAFFYPPLCANVFHVICKLPWFTLHLPDERT